MSSQLSALSGHAQQFGTSPTTKACCLNGVAATLVLIMLRHGEDAPWIGQAGVWKHLCTLHKEAWYTRPATLYMDDCAHIDAHMQASFIPQVCKLQPLHASQVFPLTSQRLCPSYIHATAYLTDTSQRHQLPPKRV